MGSGSPRSGWAVSPIRKSSSDSVAAVPGPDVRRRSLERSVTLNSRSRRFTLALVAAAETGVGVVKLAPHPACGLDV
jgi:hypothetical protein